MKGHKNGAALREDFFTGEHIRELAVGDGLDNGRPGQL